MAWKLGEAFIKLFADPRQLVSDLRKVEGDVEGAAAAMSLTWGSAFKIALIPAAAEAAGRFAAALRDTAIATIQQGDRLRELSQITNVSVEDLSRLEYAGQTAGIGLEEIGNAMRFLNKNLDAAKSGNKTMRASFADMGVSIDDVKKRGESAIDVFKRIATNVAAGNIKVEAATGAMRTMGRAGASMVPLLLEGADGIAELGARADAAGYTISTEFANDADAFGDAITLMKNEAKGFARTLTDEVMRAVMGVASIVGKTLPDNFTLGKAAAVALGAVFKSASFIWSTAFYTVSNAVRASIDNVKLFAKVVGLAAKGDFAGAWDAAMKGSEENTRRAKERAEEYQQSISKLWGMYGAYDDDQKRRRAEGESLTEEERQAIAKLNLAQQDEIKQLEIKRAQLQGNQAEVERLTQAYNEWKLAAAIDSGLSPELAQQTLELSKQTRELERNNEARKKNQKEAAEAIEKEKKRREDLAKLNLKLADDLRAVEREQTEDAIEGMRRRTDSVLEFMHVREAMSQELASLTRSEYDNAKAAIDAELADRLDMIAKSNVAESMKADAKVNAEQIALNKMRTLNGQYGVDFDAMIEQQIASFGTLTQRMKSLWDGVIGDMTYALTDIFYAAFTGNMEDMKDAFKDFMKSLLRRIVQFLAEQAVINFLKMMAKSGAGTWWGALAGAGAGAMEGSRKMANGGVLDGGFRAFASGGIVNRPTLGLIGEGSMNEAVVPLPDGRSIPVQMQGGAQEVTTNLRVVVTSDLLQAGRSSPDEIIAVVNSDVARRGGMYHQIRRTRR